MARFILIFVSAYLVACAHSQLLPGTAPDKTQAGQAGTNKCGTQSSQSSMCQNAFLNSVDDFCLYAPPQPGPASTIGDTEREEVSWCMKSGYGTRLIPDGAITGAHFIETPDFVQITGVGDLTLLNIPKGDAGGEVILSAVLFSQAPSGNLSKSMSGQTSCRTRSSASELASPVPAPHSCVNTSTMLWVASGTCLEIMVQASLRARLKTERFELLIYLKDLWPTRHSRCASRPHKLQLCNNKHNQQRCRRDHNFSRWNSAKAYYQLTGDFIVYYTILVLVIAHFLPRHDLDHLTSFDFTSGVNNLPGCQCFIRSLKLNCFLSTCGYNVFISRSRVNGWIEQLSSCFKPMKHLKL
ncbi:hypothetical protein NP233_g4325 [Leucocoprinus birnbaumii]|uniref:Uncharacterized protein n=1 Tax=Leucocoprinus birnbaumii TaxID=56174 RepID=A0AAD5VYM4_9AGAR|nr:hypothetical protein NP233_g4325 [Leucocoprinus birnbaumii]